MNDSVCVIVIANMVMIFIVMTMLTTTLVILMIMITFTLQRHVLTIQFGQLDIYFIYNIQNSFDSMHRSIISFLVQYWIYIYICIIVRSIVDNTHKQIIRKSHAQLLAT